MNGVIFACLSLCTFAVLVMGERCSSVNDCNLVMCAQNATVICEFGECTCKEGEKMCQTRDDCTQNGRTCNEHGHGLHGHGEWHCVDGMCKCSHMHM